MVVRFRYSKLGKIRFTSQRDVARMWERALRRCRMPVDWSCGFSPRPLLSFGLALPTGAESLGEYLDVQLAPVGSCAPVAVAEHRGSLSGRVASCELLSRLLPEGIDVQAQGILPMGSLSLQQEVSSCSWELDIGGVSEEQMASRIDSVLAAQEILVRRERKGREVEDDLRPSIKELAVRTVDRDRPVATSSATRVVATLATRPRGVRPGELLQGLGTDLVLVRARRTHQWIEHGDGRWEPLSACGDLPGLVAQHAQERAS
ncbi:MAG: TIGR03936 family radical SAM-associated protein [Actinomycetota bacterium]|nr:TIGR03936 family radical SAM-associated protein [Actinomycetota bacterium]